MTSDAAALTDLPGPRKFVARVRQDLDLGRSVVIVLPDDALDSGLGRQVFDCMVHATNASLDGSDLSRNDGSTPVAVAQKYFYDAELSARTSDNWGSYLLHDESHRRSTLVASWDVELRHDIPYWLRLAHASTLDRADRPTFAFLVRVGDVETDALERVDQDDVVVHWWWDVIGLIDTELTIEFVHDRGACHPMRRAMIAESVGWDIKSVPVLLEEWTDTPAALRGLISSISSGPVELDHSEKSALSHRPPSTRPPRALLRPWSRGEMNLWNGTYYFKGTIHGPNEHERRFWNAQARIIMPVLERERAKFALQFERLATKAIVEQTMKGSDLLELGPMAWAHRDKLVRLKDYSRLYELVQIRNKIAHGQPIDGDLYAKACVMTASQI